MGRHACRRWKVGKGAWAGIAVNESNRRLWVREPSSGSDIKRRIFHRRQLNMRPIRSGMPRAERFARRLVIDLGGTG
jgi:hypothetical protein